MNTLSDALLSRRMQSVQEMATMTFRMMDKLFSSSFYMVVEQGSSPKPPDINCIKQKTSLTCSSCAARTAEKGNFK
ncbi:hypothetical protein CBR_g49772 [Chara braunii]|uniref:Uncharacterized protein n=1 Tax=Chara braunii TaxID=69332 RepID=A0A388M622_CHABU|nr:hypothetical protein CBR_g49772 [Chara braunii]|eukprot:GBG89922.1 hypothetical protein CBR_g49772 [Chara braunii]